MKTIDTTFMKKYIIMVIFLLTFFLGCSEHKIAPTVSGEGNGIINASAFTTNHAYAWGLGSYSNSSAEDFVLELSDGSFNGIHYSNETTTIISINVLSLTSDKIAAGTYTYSGSNSNTEFTFKDAYARTNLINQNGDLQDGDRYEDAQGGIVTVSYPDGIFKIEYQIELVNGVTLTGSYTGKVGYYKI